MERHDALTLVMTSVVMTFWLDGCHTGQRICIVDVFSQNAVYWHLSQATVTSKTPQRYDFVANF